MTAATVSPMARPRTLARSAIALVALVATLATGVFVLASPSDAQEAQVTCPEGTTLAADGETCLSDAVNDNVTTSTSCTQGVLSADGTQCLVPRLDATPAPAASTGGSGDAATVQAPVPTFTG